MIIDDDVLKVLRVLSKEGGVSWWTLVLTHKVSESKLKLILEWLEEHNLARVIKIKMHIIVIKTKNLDDFLSKAEKTIQELEQVLASYELERVAPTPASNVDEILHKLSRSDMLCLVALMQQQQPALISSLAELTGLTRWSVSYSVKKLRTMGLVKVHSIGKLRVVELTGQGLYVAKKLEELVKLLR